MPTPSCLRCGTTRRTIKVTNTASRARFHLCGCCLSATVREMRPRSRRAVEAKIIQQSVVAS
jgi:hypothetical protein